MQVRILETPEITSKGKYNELWVKYNQDGKDKKDRVVSFGDSKDAYQALVSAQPGEAWELKKKQNGEYWNIIGASRLDGASSAAMAASPAPATSRGNWESAEERAKKQVYIIRQSCLAQAVASLGSGLNASEYMNRASEFEKFVVEGIQREYSNSEDEVI